MKRPFSVALDRTGEATHYQRRHQLETCHAWVQEITAVIGLADPASPCRARGADPALVAGGPECRRRLRPNSPRPAGPGGLRRPGAADRLTTPQCLTGGGGTSLPAEGRLEHDHSVLDGITTAEAQSRHGHSPVGCVAPADSRQDRAVASPLCGRNVKSCVLRSLCGRSGAR